MIQICLLSITASHYRHRIYNEMQKQIGCDFIFGVDNSSVKRMDTSTLENAFDVPNKYIANTQVYFQPNVIKATSKYKILINDLGIFCITAWLLLFIAKFRGQKIYNWDHGWYGRENLIKKILIRFYFGLADGAFIYGDYAINLMIQNGFNASKLYPIHNSLDYDNQCELRNTIESKSIYKDYFKNDNPVLIMIGRLNMRKNLHQLLEAVSLLRTKGKLYNINLVGDGTERSKLENLACKLNISNQVWFYGACYDEAQNAKLIYNSDMCVVPGDIGLTAIHAMTFGVPVISHDYFQNQGPEFEVIKQGLTGAFFKHNNVESLAETIEQWFVDHRVDRESVRMNCYKEIEQGWTPQYQVDIIKKAIGYESYL